MESAGLSPHMFVPWRAPLEGVPCESSLVVVSWGCHLLWVTGGSPAEYHCVVSPGEVPRCWSTGGSQLDRVP
jgi:hypothetical protein